MIPNMSSEPTSDKDDKSGKVVYSTSTTNRVTRPVREPFDTPTKNQNFNIIVDGHNHYINAHMLAHFSPFFDTLCFGEFKEAKQGVAEIQDLNRREWLIFLYAMGANPAVPYRPINDLNCAVCLKLGDRFDVPTLRKRCIDYLVDGFCKVLPDISCTIEILLACEVASITGEALQNVVSRLARFGNKQLLEKNVHKLMKNTELVAALFDNGPELKKSHKLCHIAAGTGENELYSDVCIHQDCSGMAVKCSHCKFHVCPDHLKLPCFNTAARGSGRVKWNEDMFVVIDCLSDAQINLDNYK